ncbi:MAG: hypothetical protein ACPGYV_04460 [Phycisphaeraceae bacterium]
MNVEVDATENDQPLCIHCTEPYNGLDHFCPHCGGPVSQHSAVDPMGQVFAMGHAYSSATDGRASKLVLIGMWLIFGPQLAILLFFNGWLAIDALFPSDPKGSYETGLRIEASSAAEGAVRYGVMLALTAFYGLMLYKVTAGYLRKQKEREADPIDDD